MSAIADFKVKQKRPTKLSDPHFDFTPEMLENLLSTPDAQMHESHYRLLFGPDLPGGTYKEIVYFLPLAFRYILSHEFALDSLTAVIGFCSYNENALKKDNLLEVVRECFEELLDYWTSEFCVTYTVRHEPGTSYFDYVRNSQNLAEGIRDLVRFEKFADVGEACVKDLAYHNGDPIKAAWFLEYSSIKRIIRSPSYESILHLIYDKDLLLEAALVVEREVRPHEKSPTYWRDTFKRLGLE
jgi:hypothetical protein